MNNSLDEEGKSSSASQLLLGQNRSSFQSKPKIKVSKSLDESSGEISAESRAEAEKQKRKTTDLQS